MDINDPATYSPDLYQQLINSGGDIGALQGQLQQQKAIADQIGKQQAGLGGMNRFTNSVGSTTLVGGGGKFGGLLQAGLGAAQGYMTGQQGQTMQGINSAQTGQNNAILKALMAQRGVQGGGGQDMYPTDASGNMVFDG